MYVCVTLENAIISCATPNALSRAPMYEMPCMAGHVVSWALRVPIATVYRGAGVTVTSGAEY